jgi:hypothetical protein
MSQERLVGLAVLSIEAERSRNTNIDLIIEDFAAANVQRERRFSATPNMV